MASLREVCSAFPVVVLDAASALTQVGVIAGNGSFRWCNQTDEAGVAVFQCLQELRIAPAEVKSWLYCHGPGSVLGVRTVAMALRTWGVLHPTPVFSYSSLAVVAHALGRTDAAVIADARRESWHHYEIGSQLRRVPGAELRGNLIMPEGFKHWSSLPSGVTTVPYLLSELLPKVWTADLFQRSTEPDAFLHEEPSYVTWTPHIHRAPAPS